MTAIALCTVAATACNLDKALKVQDVDVATPESVITKAGLPVLYAGGRADFQVQFTGTDASVTFPGLLTDELRDIDTFPTRIEVDQRGTQRTKITRFLPDGASVEYEERTPAVTKDTRAMPRFTLDPLSTVYVMRALPIAAGQTLSTPLTDDGRTYQMRVKVSGPEAVTTSLGRFAAWKLTSTVTEVGAPADSAHHVTAWISNDARRLPLKIEIVGAIGNFSLTLVSVTG